MCVMVVETPFTTSRELGVHKSQLMHSSHGCQANSRYT